MRICPQCRTRTEEPTCPHDGFQTVDASLYQDEEGGEDRYLGTVFEGRYRVEKLLGKGGMGSVYLADQLAVGRKVALKIMRSELASRLKEVARFQQEARAIASLAHVNIISLIDFGQSKDGALFLVMEFLEGSPLDAVIQREAPLPAERIVHIAQQVLDALGEAHRQGIVHRDLKPENLFLTKMGRTTDFVKVLDFGIAKVTGDASAGMTLTGTGMAIGSPRYMAPEQCMGQSVSPQADLYSLGAILYEMLTGRPVFVKNSATEYLFAHVREAPPHPSRDGRRLEGPLVDLVMHLLQKAPESRPKGVEEALHLLEASRGAEVVLSDEAAGTAEDLETGDTQVRQGVGIGDRTTGSRTTGGQGRAAGGAQARATGSGLVKTSGTRPAGAASAGGTAPRSISTNLRTAAHEGETGSGSELDLSAYERKGPPVAAVAAAVVALLGLGAGGWFLFGRKGESTPIATSLVTADVAAPAAAAAPAAPPANVEAAEPAKPAAEAPAAPPAAPAPPTAVAEPPAPKTIEVWVTSAPTGAAVLRGKEELGTTPYKVSWKEGEDPPVLKLLHAGHQETEVALKPSDAAAPVLVELAELPKPRSAAAKPKPAGGVKVEVDAFGIKAGFTKETGLQKETGAPKAEAPPKPRERVLVQPEKPAEAPPPPPKKKYKLLGE